MSSRQEGYPREHDIHGGQYMYCLQMHRLGFWWWYAGGAHSPEELAALGLLTFSGSRGGGDGSGSRETAGSGHGQLLTPIGPGFPALPRRLVEQIRANEYVDFMELPPAKGKTRPVTHPQEGQIVVVQAADMPSARRTIPDLVTWTQCFGLYVAVLASQQPHRVPELMAYQGIIAKASLKYKWPSWVV